MNLLRYNILLPLFILTFSLSNTIILAQGVTLTSLNGGEHVFGNSSELITLESTMPVAGNIAIYLSIDTGLTYISTPIATSTIQAYGSGAAVFHAVLWNVSNEYNTNSARLRVEFTAIGNTTITSQDVSDMSFRIEPQFIDIQSVSFDSIQCPGEKITIAYTVNSSFPATSNTQFVLELSDETGDFNSLITLAEVPAELNGEIAGIIPPSLMLQGGYAIRVRSISTSHPEVTSLVQPLDLFPAPSVAITHQGNFVNDILRVCLNDSIQLEATVDGDVSIYRWYKNGFAINSALNSLLSLTDVTTGTTPDLYLVEVSNAQGCKRTAEIDVRVNPYIRASIQSVNTACEGDTVGFQAIASVEPNLSGSMDYDWSVINQATDEIIFTSNQQAPVFSFDNAGIYTFRLSVGFTSVNDADQERCETTVQRSIIIHSKPSVILSGVASGSVFCEGDVPNLQGGINGTGVYSFHWEEDGAIVAQDTSSFLPTSLGTHSYRFVVTSQGDSCLTKSDEVTITIHENPLANFQLDGVNEANQVCLGNSIQVIGPIDEMSLSYIWDFGNGRVWDQAQFTEPINFLSEGMYDVTLTVVDILTSCADTLIQTIEVLPVPEADLIYDFPLSYCESESYPILASPVGNGTFVTRWQQLDKTTHEYQDINVSSPVYTPDYPGGVFRVEVVNTSQNLCPSYTDSIHILIHKSVQANFQLSDPLACLLDTLNLNNLSIIDDTASLAYSWDFGGATNFGQMSSAEHITNLIYNNAGLYEIMLAVQSSVGCVDTIRQNLDIRELPIVSIFSQGNMDVCSNEEVTFYAVKLGTQEVAYQWYYNGVKIDGAKDSVLQLTPSNLLAGIYSVEATNKDDLACSIFSNAIDLIVRESPTSNFQIIDGFGDVVNSACTFANVYVNNLSADTEQFVWDFGNGIASTLKDFSLPLQYDSAGVYTIKLIASNGTCQDTTSQSIIIKPRPTVSILAPSYINYCDDEVPTLEALIEGSSLVEVGWQIYDETTDQFNDISGEVFTTFTPSVGGIYRAKAIVNPLLNDCPGYSNQVEVTINKRPTAQFVFVEDEICLTETIGLINQSPIANEQIPNVNYHWVIGGEFTFIGEQPENIIPSNPDDALEVSLVAVTDEGCADTTIRYIKINELPSPRILSSTGIFTKCSNDGTVKLIARMEVPIDGSLFFLWKKNGEPIGGFTSDSTFTPDEASGTGIYTVEVMVEETGCSKESEAIDFQVQDAPLFHFDLISPACVGGATQFQFVSDDDNTLTGIETDWIFQLGDTASGGFIPTASFTYQTTGFKTVKLVGRNLFGCSAIYTETFLVRPKPNAIVEIDRLNSCLGDVITFSDNSSPSQLHLWDLGDGTELSEFNTPFTHVYQDSGTYSVYLYLEDFAGCKDTTMKNVRINSLPVANFTLNFECTDRAISLTDHSSAATNSIITRWEVNYGDNEGQLSTDSNQLNFSHIYENDGLYDIDLKVEDSRGCESVVYEQTQLVTPIFSLDIEFPPACVGNSVSFQSIVSFVDSITGNSPEYDWKIDGEQFSTQASPSLTVDTAGDYQISLFVTMQEAGYFCVKEVTKILTVFAVPTINMFASPSAEVCEGTVITLLTGLNNLDTSNYTYQWQFWDGLQFQNLNDGRDRFATYQPEQSGRYRVIIQNVGPDSCEAIYTNNVVDVTIHPNPIVQFNLSEDTVCVGEGLNSNNLSIITSGEGLQYLWEFEGETNLGQFAITQDINDLSYEFAGQFKVRLQATSAVGDCVQADSQFVTVHGLPEADFEISSPPICVDQPMEVPIQNSSLGGSQYDWYFGNNYGSEPSLTGYSVQIPVDSLSLVGSYSIKLVVSNTKGCQDSVLKFYQIDSPLEVSFTAKLLNDGNCNDFQNIYELLAKVSIGTDSILWDFGDGTHSDYLDASNLLIEHDYPRNSSDTTYIISLTAMRNGLCEKVYEQEVLVYGRPKIDFSYEQGFRMNSEIKKLQCISLVNTDDSVFTDYMRLTAHAMPLIDFDFSWKLQNTGQLMGSGEELNYQFVNPTRIRHNQGLYYESEFSNGYQVKLYAIDEFGCEAETLDTVHVNYFYRLLMPAGFSPNGDLLNDEFSVEVKELAIQTIHVKIYDRYGSGPIYEYQGNDASKIKWDGLHQQTKAPAPAGKYYCTIMGTFEDGEPIAIECWITLFRNGEKR